MGGGYILFNLFFVPYKRERLFINGILGAMSVMFIGIWIGKQLDLKSTISTDAMRTLTEELFQYSVFSLKEEELHLEQICVNDILEQSLAGFYGVFMKESIVPDIQMTEVKVMRFLDKVALRRIFDNILSNAARYTDGDLSVKLFSDGRITFSNHAAKLDRIQAERLFERFYTVESAKNSTGLGLSIARLLTKKMTGNIKAEYTDGELVIQVDF